MYHFGPPSWIALMSALVSLTTSVLVWRRRANLGARYLAWTTILNAVWAASASLEYASTTVAGKLLWSQMAYLGVTTTPVLHLLFGLAYGRQRDELDRRTLIALFVVPAITVLLAATNNQHHLIWARITIQPETNLALYDHGPAFIFFVLYAYAALVAGTWSFMYGVLHASRHYRPQALAVLVAAILPVAGNLVYLFGLGPWPGLDWTPITFAGSAALLVWSMDHLRLFDLMPVIRTQLMEMMNEGVLAVDQHGRIVDLNHAMHTILSSITSLQIGQRADVALSAFPALVQALQSEGRSALVLHVQHASGTRWYDTRVSSLQASGQNHLGHLVVLRDVTSQHQLAAERDGLIADLQSALAEVNTLSGLLPICAQCKKIRDDGGYWHSVEAYLSKHSTAEFTHGICPECLRELYPELADPLPQEQSDPSASSIPG